MLFSARSALQYAFLALFFGVTTPSWALFINGAATTDRRFEDGTFSGTANGNPVENPSFIYGSLDWSGVGWRTKEGVGFDESRISVTLLSPTQFIGATHIRAQVGDSISFLGSDGIQRNYTVESIEIIKNLDNSDSDLYIGTFTEIVSSTIAFYDLYSGIVAGEELLVYGNRRVNDPAFNKQVGIQTLDVAYTSLYSNANIIGLNQTTWMLSTYQDSDLSDKEAYFQVDDSSSPTFIDNNGELQLVGLHSAIAALTDLPVNPSGDTGFANFDADVTAYESQIDGIIVIPEPGTGLLLLGGFSLLAWRRR